MKVNVKHYFLWVFSALIALSVAMTGCNCDDQGPLGSLGVLATNQPGNSVIFADVQINKAQKKTFLLYNDGERELTVSSLSVIGDSDKVFKIINPPKTPFTLASGKSAGQQITVQFLPTKVKTFEGRIRIESSDANNVDASGAFFVTLRHQNLTPDPVWSCGSTLNFGSVEKGKSLTKECVLKNRGNADLVISKVTYVKDRGGEKQDFKWVSPSFPLTVKADDKKGVTVKITYAPSDYPPREDIGAFVLESNLKTSPTNKPRLKVVGQTAVALVQLIPLYKPCKSDADCRRIDSRLRCSKDEPSKKSLCLQAPNTTPVLKFPLTSKGKTTKRTFLIRSVGDKTLVIDEISLDSATSKDFKVITQGVTFPLKLAPKQEKEITVEYTPTDEVEDKGKATVTSNAGNAPKAPVLLEAASRGCNLEVLPRTIDFPGPKAVQVTILNKGNESCVVDKVFIKSGKSEPFSLLPAPQPNQTLVPSGTFAFLVKFTPKNKDVFKDAIIIESSDPDEPTIEIPLKGQVTGDRPCELAATPATLNYGLVPVGRSRKISVTVENKGYGDCEVSSINVVGTNPANNTAFLLTSPVKAPLKIESGKNLRLDVAYTPPAERSGYEGNLVIQSNDTKQPNFNVKLTGSSGTLCLEIVPPNMDFGSTKFGCSTPRRKIEVFNLGSAKCTKTISVTGLKLSNNTNGEFLIKAAPTTPKTLTAGQSIAIDLAYKAKDLGVDTATLDIENSVAGQSPIPVPLVGEGVSTSEQKDVFKQLSQPLVDIMFSVDDSCSMGEEQGSLATNFKSFINWAVRLNVDYQIMVTTTDVTKSTGPKAAGCARGTTRIVTPSTPNPIAEFQKNVKVGTNGSATEAGLESIYRALIPPASTGCNKGFYRQAASLSIIFVSDEPDQSKQTVQFYISFLKSLKKRDLDKIRASAIVGPPPSGCRSPGTGNASSGPRYWEVAKQLKGVREAICSSNWAGTLSNIGSITFGYRTQFFLTRQADPKTIVVTVNGVRIKEDPTDGWSYDASTNSITFSKSELPAPGSAIVVDYTSLCLP